MVFEASETGKIAKDFGTRDHLRKTAISVMNNIPEGFSRFSIKDKKRFFDISQSSCSELKSMMYSMEDLKYMDLNQINNIRAQADKTRNYTLAFIKYLNE